MKPGSIAKGPSTPERVTAYLERVRDECRDPWRTVGQIATAVDRTPVAIRQHYNAGRLDGLKTRTVRRTVGIPGTVIGYVRARQWRAP